MNDRELLEFAAKAAGYQFQRSKHGHWLVITPEGDHTECCFGRQRFDPYTGEDLGESTIEMALAELDWSPITDDRDVFRLAVKLTLEIDITHTGIAVRTPFGHKILIDANEEPDGYIATRLAITRAAAEIGKAMQG